MPSKIILSFLRISVSILFYLLVIITLIFTVISILNISGNNQAKKLNRKTFSYEVVDIDSKKTETPYTVSADSLVAYHPIQNHYTIEVQPNSAFGYYAFLSRLLFMALGIGVLWNFKKIFKETNLDHPFRASIARRLKILAAIFIISDILNFINYLVFNNLLHQSISSPRFQLLTDVGNGIITGLIIFVISIIYQRGTAFQEETALTV
jgi:DUF2975 family protein